MRALFLLIFISSVFIGCSIFGSDDKKAEVNFTVQRNLVKEGAFFLSFTAGHTSRVLTNQDFRGEAGLTSSSFETPTSGQLSIMFELKNPQTNQLVSQGNFQLELKEDWRYGISFRADSAEANLYMAVLAV